MHTIIPGAAAHYTSGRKGIGVLPIGQMLIPTTNWHLVNWAYGKSVNS